MSNTTTPTNLLQEVVELLHDTKGKCAVILGDPHAGHGHIALMVTSALDNLINRIGFIGGITAPKSSTVVDFPPVTNFMGEDIIVAGTVNVEDFNPEDHERAEFIAKVQKLVAELPSLAPEGLLNAFTLPEDQLVIRGAAKSIGIEDFEDAPIDITLIERMQELLKKRENSDAENQRVEAELKKQAELAVLNGKRDEVSARLADLKAAVVSAEEKIKANPTDKKLEKELSARLDAVSEAQLELSVILEEINKLAGI